MVSDHRHHVILPHIRYEANIHFDRNLVRQQSLHLRSSVAAHYSIDVEGRIKKILLQRLYSVAVADEPVDLQLLPDGSIVEGLLQLRKKLTILLVGNLSVAIEVLDGHLVAMYSKLLGTFSPGCTVEFKFEVDDSLDAQIHYDLTSPVL